MNKIKGRISTNIVLENRDLCHPLRLIYMNKLEVVFKDMVIVLTRIPNENWRIIYTQSNGCDMPNPFRWTAHMSSVATGGGAYRAGVRIRYSDCHTAPTPDPSSWSLPTLQSVGSGVSMSAKEPVVCIWLPRAINYLRTAPLFPCSNTLLIRGRFVHSLPFTNYSKVK